MPSGRPPLKSKVARLNESLNASKVCVGDYFSVVQQTSFRRSKNGAVRASRSILTPPFCTASNLCGYIFATQKMKTNTGGCGLRPLQIHGGSGLRPPTCIDHLYSFSGLQKCQQKSDAVKNGAVRIHQLALTAPFIPRQKLVC